MTISTLLNNWMALPETGFSRDSRVDDSAIHCDCSGLINLLFDQLDLTKPYGIANPKAVHYYSILQEIGSRHISQIRPWSLMVWRKDNLPKSGDTGHVLLAAGVPEKMTALRYHLEVIDATRACNGLARRKIVLHTNEDGNLIGVQLHLSEPKVKRSPIYHAPLLNNRYCLACGVTRKLCLCGQVAVSNTQPAIIIFRHPDERKKSLSTVALIKQRYPAVLVKEGELFSPPRNKNLTLVFPEIHHEAPENGKIQNSISADDLPSDATLILLDATWRKAKRMLHENPWLSGLPRVSIRQEGVSDYLLRKVPDTSALSTVEAFAAMQKDHELNALFRHFMKKQIALMGQATYEKNYRHFLNYQSY